MEPRAKPSLAAIVVADQADDQGRALALKDVGGAPLVSLAMSALDEPHVGPRFLVLGCGADDVQAQINTPGWEILSNDHWQNGSGYGVCMAMERLPLADGFLLSMCGDDHALVADDVVERLGNEYLQARLKLGRIIIPKSKGKRGWPCLIDIGFRQPFQAMADGASFESILEANAEQVVEVDFDA